MNIEQEKMIVESLPSLYPMMPEFEEDAIHTVLDALPRWIPVTERLPENNGDYLTTLRLLTFYHVEACRFHDGVWDSVPFDEVVAWMPLPEPYKGVTT